MLAKTDLNATAIDLNVNVLPTTLWGGLAVTATPSPPWPASNTACPEGHHRGTQVFKLGY